ncbi:MAG: sigma-54-dependent transcriptional regulator [Bauldia sp.]
MRAAAPRVPVLIVDADPGSRRLLADHLGRVSGERFRPTACGSLEEARELAAMEGAGVVIADVESVGGPAGLAPLGAAGTLIAISARGSVARAVEAMRAGAADFLPKPIGARALIERLELALSEQPPRPRPMASVAAAAPRTAGFEGFVGDSALMRSVYERIDRVAASRAPVFITGESGSGKEVCAVAIHERGGAGRPFVAINCGALPRDLVESELFGHVRGAFTGAAEDRLGAAELADGGTLFLDEIGEMPLPLQAKLLRFVQTGLVQRVGDARARPVDIRIICATNRDPAEAVAAGTFRGDLLYRLNVLPIRLPPLRDRRDDIAPLARHFLALAAGEEGMAPPILAPAAADFLAEQPWPGNVRELQNVIRRIVVMQRPQSVTATVVAAAFADSRGATLETSAKDAPSVSGATLRPFHEEERRIIEAAIAAHGGNISRAAASLQINQSTIYRKRQAWGIDLG